MPITPNPLNQSTSNKKVIPPITFYSESKTFSKFQKGVAKKPPPTL